MQANKPTSAQSDAHSAEFTDIDEFTAAMSGWDMDWQQLEAGRPKIQTSVISCRETVIQRYYISHKAQQRGSAPDDFATFGFANPKSPMNIGGSNIPELGILFNFNNPNGFEMISGSEFGGISVSFPREKFFHLARQFKIDESQITEGKLAFAKVSQSDELGAVRNYLNALNHGDSDARSKKTFIDTELPYRFLNALAGLAPEPSSENPTARRKGLRQALEFIDANAQDNPSIIDICFAVDVSPRSLNRAFNEYFGIGPKRYLLNLRLLNVRRQLRNTSDDLTKVADIANEWEFWHMGDFAREYRQFFGEYPAESLNS